VALKINGTLRHAREKYAGIHLNVIDHLTLPHTLTLTLIMPSSKTKAPEDSESLEPELNTTIATDPGEGDESSSGSDEEASMAAASESGPSRPSKKKKKKRSKIARAIAAIKGDSVPQAVVDQVVAKVKEEHGEDSVAADEDTIRELLKQLKLKDVAEGKAGFFGKNKKDTGGHKVCYLCGERNRYLSGIDVARWCSSGRRNPYPTTVRQHIYIYVYPVRTLFNRTCLDDGDPEEDGCIEPSKPREEVRQEPFPLPKDFEWSVLDILEPSQV